MAADYTLFISSSQIVRNMEITFNTEQATEPVCGCLPCACYPSSDLQTLQSSKSQSCFLLLSKTKLTTDIKMFSSLFAAHVKEPSRKLDCGSLFEGRMKEYNHCPL